jgi:outer membrane lipoprotein LolB
MSRLFALILLLALSGCATFQGGGTDKPVGLSPDQLVNWSLEGRIGVHAAKDSWQADLAWSHDPKQDRLRLSGPLSQGLVSIILQRDLIYINEGDGIDHLARDPEAALKARLGFAVPLKSLRCWVLGIPNAGEPWQPLAAGPEGAFVQQGWRIVPSSAVTVGGYSLPGRLLIEGGGVRLKIIVDQWNPSSPTAGKS